MYGFAVIPAVDIMKGKCVRLLRGRFDAQTVYEEDPLKAAMRWVEEGAEWLHIVDLDGALEGKPKNLEALIRIRKAVECRVQFGGGIRCFREIETILSVGVDRVVLGTIAVEDFETLSEAVRRWGKRIAVAVDVKGGKVAIRGWAESSSLEPMELLSSLERIGVTTVIYTDVLRDGTMLGPNLEAIKTAACKTSLSIIASGGISKLEHIAELARLYPKVCGCIVGRALYEGKLYYREAVMVAKKAAGSKGGERQCASSA
ncbi:MAG: 1-(5-phosphoribosyl)-5-[(5-phosphoribosylamino)methylideneamino]imidazole-4-carboxamide isomerase [Armatimonadota bacterium]|nr:1-(5-phosphoribosyl)-5-[(5-phosphoribosylamino)methylideneamino]imidazole-4-carboxamide isomerase [Armatimonadota bacterium]MCX7778200.1 1-(5-phosphoribosyl)-5-[(5-phosphoribosylamino)methylideneamino]imidazole-4-carboxamide isomerase [Armatimonadota bacterium]MDW8025686.1 1-(5-phosphoribosyl)-5-[(5-phosphoribosylamino)methylideneamino]imidazole-4-carboxamide isomerase [Armatimonadota bacterium]